MAVCWGEHLGLVAAGLDDLDEWRVEGDGGALVHVDEYVAACRAQGRTTSEIDAGCSEPRAAAGGILRLTGILWDRSPRQYQGDEVAHLLVRWARRWQPGGTIPTRLGDDLITLVRAVDSEVLATLRAVRGDA